jgi:DNA-directed RNA polymerase specialized sigma54-like protein
MKQTLQLKLSQHLTLTPQLQQSIRLLQLSTMELNQELEKFLAENPLLEREDTDSETPAPPAHMNGEPATAIQAPAEEPSPIGGEKAARARVRATTPTMAIFSRSPPSLPTCVSICAGNSLSPSSNRATAT